MSSTEIGGAVPAVVAKPSNPTVDTNPKQPSVEPLKQVTANMQAQTPKTSAEPAAAEPKTPDTAAETKPIQPDDTPKSRDGMPLDQETIRAIRNVGMNPESAKIILEALAGPGAEQLIHKIMERVNNSDLSHEEKQQTMITFNRMATEARSRVEGGNLNKTLSAAMKLKESGPDGNPPASPEKAKTAYEAAIGMQRMTLSEGNEGYLRELKSTQELLKSNPADKLALDKHSALVNGHNSQLAELAKLEAESAAIVYENGEKVPSQLEAFAYKLAGNFDETTPEGIKFAATLSKNPMEYILDTMGRASVNKDENNFLVSRLIESGLMPKDNAEQLGRSIFIENHKFKIDKLNLALGIFAFIQYLEQFFKKLTQEEQH